MPDYLTVLNREDGRGVECRRTRWWAHDEDAEREAYRWLRMVTRIHGNGPLTPTRYVVSRADVKKGWLIVATGDLIKDVGGVRDVSSTEFPGGRGVPRSAP